MQVLSLFVIVPLTGALGLLSLVLGMRLAPPARPKWQVLGIAALPGLALLLLFYSLAIHMHRCLGVWPRSIGAHGFPGHLIMHANIAAGYFQAMFLGIAFLWPLAFLVCLVARWRSGLCFLGAFVLSWSACFGLMMMAPPRFLDWWWD